MSIATLILGGSGTGKTASLRNLDPKKVLLLQTVKKPLPFKSTGWDRFDPETKTGSVYHTDNASYIIAGIKKAKSIGKSIVILDDAQYQMANNFFAKALEKGFEKFNVLGKEFWDILTAAISAEDDIRVYVLSHVDQDEYGGNIRMKTLGKMLSDKATPEGLFTTVLRSHVANGRYFLTTQNDGTDTVKSPIGLFSDLEIDNDLNEIDKQLCEYYGVKDE